MSRLSFGPKPKTMEVTDIRTGHFVFTPLAGQHVSFADLERSIKKAGYEVETVTMIVSGVYTDDGKLKVPGGQVFRLTAPAAELRARLGAVEPGERLRLKGAWRTENTAELLTVTEILDPLPSAQAEDPQR